MDLRHHLQKALSGYVAEYGLRPTARELNLRVDVLRSILSGHDPLLSNAEQVARALGFALDLSRSYLYSPDTPEAEWATGAADSRSERDPPDLYTEARHTDADPPESAAESLETYGLALPSARLRDLEVHTQGLVRIVWEAGGNPIPDDVRDALLQLRTGAWSESDRQ